MADYVFIMSTIGARLIERQKSSKIVDRITVMNATDKECLCV